MKKLLLSSLFTILATFGFAQQGTNNHPNFDFPINHELGDILFNSVFYTSYSSSHF